MTLEPIYLKFDGESFEEAVKTINEIFDGLFDNNRYIVYISFRIIDGLPLSTFIAHSRNIREPMRYEFRVFEVLEDACMVQKSLEREFVSAQNQGWRIKTCRVMDTHFSLLLQKIGV